MAVRVGTSGWSYRDWAGEFYPQGLPTTRWFSHYATRFPTVEINYSFYRLPSEATVGKWHATAPAGFRFAVKGSRYITHNLKLLRPGEPLANVTTRLAPLGEHLGVWLWQLPPNLRRDDARLEAFLAALPRRWRHAVEFRHGTWFDDAVFDLLSRHGAACVWLSTKDLPDVAPLTASFVYLRFHGLAGGYRYDYTAGELEPWAARLRDASAKGRDGWAYFNNDWRANAPHNAAVLVDLLGDDAVAWPPRRSA